MRARLVFTTALLLGAASAGCTDFLNDPNIFPDGSGGAAGAGGTGGTTTTTTTDTTPEPGCIPNMGEVPVGDDCGVFVSVTAGNDMTGDGTKGKPYATPTKAVEMAAGKPIYMCAEAFTGPFEIQGSALIYGGLDCANDWAYVGLTTPTDISAGADEIPLRIASDIAVELQDTRVVAADATVAGGSSIAILVNTGATLSLVRSIAEAGNGAAGTPGPFYDKDAADGKKGSDGVDACSAATGLTPDAPASGCGDPDSAGGAGGVGNSGSGTPGGAGEPLDFTNGGDGDASGQCKPGTIGNVGASGMGGPGAAGVGMLDPTKGYIGVSGSDGTAGKPGQGGGGGGGSRGGSGMNKCPDPTMAGGASGGSGGSGGCGGLGGKGGGPGGSSIAIVSLGKELKFDSVKLVAKAGANGGEGGPGQTGGLAMGGGVGGKVPMGATLLKAGCNGGPGGAGGAGGQGGGGLGGHSIGIAHKGSTIDGMPEFSTDKAGDGGLGDGDTGKGAAGVSKQIQEF